MKRDTLTLLVTADDIDAYVRSLWSDGPIPASHEQGGIVADVVRRFARVPRLFYDASDPAIEWTHFSTWWGAIMRCDYANPAIRDLRFLHEIYHAATMPYLANANVPTFEAMNFRNEREASCFTEMAIYCALPELRPIAFEHPIFVDRFLFPSGDTARPDGEWLQRWRDGPDLVFQQLMYERARVILAAPDEIDRDDPQIVWLRRYGEQGANWIRVWTARFREVQDAMLALQGGTRAGDRPGAAARHLDWLTSDAVSGAGDIPFRDEAIAFRAAFDTLISLYDRAMRARNEVAVRGINQD